MKTKIWAHNCFITQNSLTFLQSFVNMISWRWMRYDNQTLSDFVKQIHIYHTRIRKYLPCDAIT